MIVSQVLKTGSSIFIQCTRVSPIVGKLNFINNLIIVFSEEHIANVDLGKFMHRKQFGEWPLTAIYFLWN